MLGNFGIELQATINIYLGLPTTSFDTVLFQKIVSIILPITIHCRLNGADQQTCQAYAAYAAQAAAAAAAAQAQQAQAAVQPREDGDETNGEPIWDCSW